MKLIDRSFSWAACNGGGRTKRTAPFHTIHQRGFRLGRPMSSRPLSVAKTEEDHASPEDLSEEYTDVMQHRMGTSLVYRHEDGMNYHRIMEDLIVGSCLQNPKDVDTLADREAVRSVLCLQEDSDMDYFSLDIGPIRERCATRSDIAHMRHAIRDFDPFSLRRRLPGAVALLSQAAARRQGTVYVHCTAGMGRAPATGLAYMWWVKGIPLDEAYSMMTSIRPCKPNTNAIRAAAVDLLYGQDPIPVTLTIARRGTAQNVEVAGLDVGWGQSVTLKPSNVSQRLSVQRRLPSGTYQFKFIWDGVWGPCLDHLTVVDGGNLNNYVVVPDVDMGPDVASARGRLRSEGGDLTADERAVIIAKLESMQVDPHSTSAPTGV